MDTLLIRTDSVNDRSGRMPHTKNTNTPITPITLDLPPPFDEAVARHERELMRFLLRTTRDHDDALDLFQETWLRAYRAWPKLEPATGLRPWRYRIATNLSLNRARDRRPRPRATGDR